MTMHAKIDWTSPQAYLPGFEPPTLRQRLAVKLDHALTAVAARFERRRVQGVKWQNPTRGSPHIPSHLRADIGLAPLPEWKDYARYL